MDTPENIYYHYHFHFDDGRTVDFKVDLDPVTLEYLPPAGPSPPDWTLLNYDPRCPDCPHEKSRSRYCPIAANIATVVEAFKDANSFDVVDVRVVAREREYLRKQIAIQQAISSLLGIIMVTSGCEDLDRLRPMVKFHLPFASITETIYRAATMYMLAQYFRHKHGLEADWNLQGLIGIYKEIDQINVIMCERINKATRKDASLNAVVILDVFAQMVPMSIEDTLAEFEALFASYLR